MHTMIHTHIQVSIGSRISSSSSKSNIRLRHDYGKNCKSNKLDDDGDDNYNDDDDYAMTVSQENLDLSHDLSDNLNTSQPQSNQFEHINDHNFTNLQPAPAADDNLDVYNEAMNEAFSFEMHSDREKMLADHHVIHTNIAEFLKTASEQMDFDDTMDDNLNSDTVPQSISTETSERETTTLEPADDRTDNFAFSLHRPTVDFIHNHRFNY